VDDSGWIDVDQVTALIGTNESGKTNLLLPLWKLNPARGGELNATSDYPRKRFNEIRAMDTKPVFISAEFELDDAKRARVAALTDVDEEQVAVVRVSRRFSGGRVVEFPNANPIRDKDASAMRVALVQARAEIVAATASKTEEPLKAAMLEAAAAALSLIDEHTDSGGRIAEAGLTAIRKMLDTVDPDSATRRSSIAPPYGRLLDVVKEAIDEVTVLHPAENVEARKLVLAALPKFVYYSNYGNLDSEIYLPHVIDNMERDDLGAKEEAKVRTLKVLFDFVRLEAQEILELGRDFRAPPNRPDAEPTEEQIAAIAEKKKQRSILMQSASAELTDKFRDWWRQGDYRFRLEADGDHFRIWVSDDRRPEEIELEGRSTGLQWFLSFYLIFLVESRDAHEGAVLLLDEPGISLHPLAQRDLSEFFDQLSTTNPLLYTTHSPFLVDPDRLDRVKAVYVREDGTTAISPDLRAAESKTSQGRSVYPVYAALGLTLSETLLQGSQAVLVEGASDQIYLTALKLLLIGEGRITPSRELLFIPTGGVKGIRAVAPILTGKDEEPPFALLDADGAGIKLAQQLKGEIYAGDQGRLLSVGEFVPDVQAAEIEDLIPTDVMEYVVGRWLRGEEDFTAKSQQSIVGQIEAYASASGILLEQGWKVDLARRVKARLLQRGTRDVPGSLMDSWTALFNRFAAG
jgi:energy-coupling factor transporter ATP-binding protein EcfA2